MGWSFHWPYLWIAQFTFSWWSRIQITATEICARVGHAKQALPVLPSQIRNIIFLWCIFIKLIYRAYFSVPALRRKTKWQPTAVSSLGSSAVLRWRRVLCGMTHGNGWITLWYKFLAISIQGGASLQTVMLQRPQLCWQKLYSNSQWGLIYSVVNTASRAQHFLCRDSSRQGAAKW